jgi:hypothetical protein
VVFTQLQFLAPLLTAIFALALGLFVFLERPKSVSHLYFFLTALLIAVWSVMVAIFHLHLGAEHLGNLHWIAGFFIAPAYFLFLFHFPSAAFQISNIKRFFIWLGAFAIAIPFILWPEQLSNHTR